jgi:hypothetical protein
MFSARRFGLALGAPVLMISLDGMRPDSVTHAVEHGLKLPDLQRFVKEGAYADVSESSKAWLSGQPTFLIASPLRLADLC